MHSQEANHTPQYTRAEAIDIAVAMKIQKDLDSFGDDLDSLFGDDFYDPPASFCEASPKGDPMKVDKAEPKVEVPEQKHSKAKEATKTKSVPFDPAKLKAAMAARPKATKSPKANLATASKPTGVKKSTHVKPAVSRPAVAKESTGMKQDVSKAAAVKASTEIKPAVSKPAGAKGTTIMKPTGTGSKPTGVKKSVKKPSIAKPLKLGKEVSIDTVLSKAQIWIDRPKQWSIKDPETGCYGLSTHHAEGERREITIVHSINCDCLDVRLMHICKHVDGLIRKRQLARRSRDAFIITTKLDVELPQPIPKDIRFPHVKEQIIDTSVRKHLIKASRGQIPTTRGEQRKLVRPWREELEDEKKATVEGWEKDREESPETETRSVVDSYHQQTLIEKWKSLKGYKKRLIWRDW